MQSPPYDRALALASLIRTMKDHWLDVRCGCGARRMIALASMARDQRIANLTLAHVALKLVCEGCRTGPDSVHMTQTSHGLGPAPTASVSLGWSLPLIKRPGDGAKWLRNAAI